MNQVAVQSRIPLPVGSSDIDQGKWRILCETIFPSARSAEAILMAMDYCRIRHLDIFKKPVNIVPMWSAAKSAYVETVWEGINSIQVTASRTQSWAGMDEPKWGPDIKHKFKGSKKGEVGPVEVEITYPEYCSVTVYRVVQGERYAFTETVYWLEAYARIGKSELPNDMWAKRPKGQLHKCTKAASLRAAFPEEAAYTAEEMEGKTLEEVEIPVASAFGPTTGEITAKQAYGSAKAMKAQWSKIRDEIVAAKSDEHLNEILDDYRADLSTFQSIDPQLYNSLISVSDERHKALGQTIPGIGIVHREGSEADIRAMQGYKPEADDFLEH